VGDSELTSPPAGVASPDAAYRAALESLFARTGGSWSFGLDRMRDLLACIGNPHLRLSALHIAGTNGKGSVVATLDGVLRGKGLRTGRYTSPHLVDFRERIVIDGRATQQEAITEWLERWQPIIVELGATFFEATTAMAFDLFARESLDVCVIETGLGGRLDATNVIQPSTAAITSVGLDHVEYLGDSLEAIAREKAGIFKSGAHAVIGELDEGLCELMTGIARDTGATSITTVREHCTILDVQVKPTETICLFRLHGEEIELSTPLVGRHQAQNLATALLTLHSSALLPPRQQLAPLISRVRLPGRFQRINRFVFDVAHNPVGAETTANTVREAGAEKPVVVLLTVLADKDWRSMMSALAPVAEHFILTRAPSAPSSREWEPSVALQYAAEQGWSASLVEDFGAALSAAGRSGATVLVTGSFHTVGDAMARLQVDPLAE
jgi:dihydrofolate synthase / folylpolyglutamate synthase